MSNVPKHSPANLRQAERRAFHLGSPLASKEASTPASPLRDGGAIAPPHLSSPVAGDQHDSTRTLLGIVARSSAVTRRLVPGHRSMDRVARRAIAEATMSGGALPCSSASYPSEPVLLITPSTVQPNEGSFSPSSSWSLSSSSQLSSSVSTSGGVAWRPVRASCGVQPSDGSSSLVSQGQSST